MIARLTGQIIEINPPLLVLEIAGVGYEIWCPLNTFDELTKGKHTLHTQMIVREDSQTLYGFNSADEKTIFNELLRVNGVGAKVALAILSTLSIADILSCVANDEVSLLQQTPGIGKKTAQKLIVELKDRLEKLSLNNPSNQKTAGNTQNQIHRQKASLALQTLGFKAREVEKMMADIDTQDLSTEQLIRLALQNK